MKYYTKTSMKISTEYENGMRNTYKNQSEMVAMTDSINHTARPGAMQENRAGWTTRCRNWSGYQELKVNLRTGARGGGKVGSLIGK